MSRSCLLLLSLPFLAISCSSDPQDKDEISIENMVLNETQEEEWTHGADFQEQIIAETPDAPIKLDAEGDCR